jgi:hypothetical protein
LHVFPTDTNTRAAAQNVIANGANGLKKKGTAAMLMIANTLPMLTHLVAKILNLVFVGCETPVPLFVTTLRAATQSTHLLMNVSYYAAHVSKTGNLKINKKSSP